VLLLIVGLVIKKCFILYTLCYNIFILSDTLHRRGVETSEFAACKATYFKIKLRKLYVS